jgi:uncharacterized protein YbcI
MMIDLDPKISLVPVTKNGRCHLPFRSPDSVGESPQSAVKTKGEIEAAICSGISRFEQDYMGRGPKKIQAHLLGDLLLVRLTGVLTPAEQQLAKATFTERGRDLVKQSRSCLIATARPLLEVLVHEITGVKILSVHHDVSTVTGEEVVLFTLASEPHSREIKKAARY